MPATQKSQDAWHHHAGKHGGKNTCSGGGTLPSGLLCRPATPADRCGTGLAPRPWMPGTARPPKNPPGGSRRRCRGCGCGCHPGWCSGRRHSWRWGPCWGGDCQNLPQACPSGGPADSQYGAALRCFGCSAEMLHDEGAAVTFRSAAPTTEVGNCASENGRLATGGAAALLGCPLNRVQVLCPPRLA